MLIQVVMNCFVTLVLSVLANTFTFGGTDALGWTDSASYEGSQYTVSRVTATVARETAITAATLGIGTAARGGSAAAQAAYKGILVAEAATGGYQIGTGAQQMSEGNYEAGALNVVAGGLRVGGSIVSAGAVPSKGQKVYRVFGENNKPLGESWTPVDPSTVKNFRSSAGLPDSNTGRFVVEGTIRDTSGITVRKALPLDGNPGGLPEYVIPNANTKVIIDRVSGANPGF